MASDEHSFERAARSPGFHARWLSKLSRSLCEAAGEGVRDRVMEGSQESPSGGDLIEWTRGAMERLEALLGEEAGEVMTGCACQYPRERLGHLRERYAETGDLDLVHGMLQEQFLATTRDFLGLDEGQLKDIVRRGWGVAGVRRGNTIIATKMPFEYHDYFRAATPEERRYRFCHCQGVREAIKRGETLPATYCYCGAGFYRGIWEYILQRPVRVEVLESVLRGDDACRIAIHLPPDA